MAAVQAAASKTLEHVDTDYRAAQEQLLCAGEDRDLKLAAMQLLLALQKERVLLMRKGEPQSLRDVAERLWQWGDHMSERSVHTQLAPETGAGTAKEVS
ncbi:hypothetical protein OEZ86_005356 [Tetradesmus obliquus]|nr:hypothetical protein OEZ86_005356 [Tetradesmus obliquus]